MTITGAGSGATAISKDDHADRVFDIASGVSASISGVTITGGRTPDASAGSTVGNSAEAGGGIRNAGTLTLSDVTVTGNATGAGGQGSTAGDGSGYTGGGGGYGGGIANAGTLTITNRTEERRVGEKV